MTTESTGAAAPPTGPFVLLAGATGDLGMRIARHLTAAGARVHAPVREASAERARAQLEPLGVRVDPVDLTDVDALAEAARGADCVVSAVSGTRDVILDLQTVLLDAAVRAGVPRFIPSDYSADFTKTKPGHNRNFDLRREFAGRADRAPIRVTSVLNGAFMDMLGAEIPIIQPRLGAVLYWGSADQPLDFTTREDTAAVTAAAALDEAAPRYLRVAGDTVSARQIAATLNRPGGRRYRPVPAGTVGTLRAMAALTRRIAPAKPDPTFPAWQGMAYMVDMFSGDARLHPLDNDRYPVSLTSLPQQFETRHPDAERASA